MLKHARFELCIVEYSLIIALDIDVETGIDQLFGGGGGKSGSSFKFLLFTTKPESGRGHFAGVNRM